MPSVARVVPPFLVLIRVGHEMKPRLVPTNRVTHEATYLVRVRLGVRDSAKQAPQPLAI